MICALVLALIDLREHRLPNRIIYPWALFTLALLPLLGLLLGDGSAVLRAVAAGLTWALVFLGIRLVHPPSLGMGDVKLVLVLGVYAGFLGWSAVGAAVVLSCLSGGLVSAVLLVTRRASRHTAIPFGPFLLLGTGLALLLS
nr:A24 family peptidase [Nesterenkonia lacusekhoensis]